MERWVVCETMLYYTVLQSTPLNGVDKFMSAHLLF